RGVLAERAEAVADDADGDDEHVEARRDQQPQHPIWELAEHTGLPAGLIALGDGIVRVVGARIIGGGVGGVGGAVGLGGIGGGVGVDGGGGRAGQVVVVVAGAGGFGGGRLGPRGTAGWGGRHRGVLRRPRRWWDRQVGGERYLCHPRS